jgi:hypothetical protein
MVGAELLVAFAQRQRLGGLNETAGAVGIFVEIHPQLPQPVPVAQWHGQNIVTGRVVRLKRPIAAPPRTECRQRNV